MRWAVVRLIAVREVRDQLRDRRTMFLILGLPVLMYPLFIGVALMFASTLQDKKLVVGVVGMDYLPQPGVATPGAARPYPPLIVDGKFPNQYLPKESEPH